MRHNRVRWVDCVVVVVGDPCIRTDTAFAPDFYAFRSANVYMRRNPRLVADSKPNNTRRCEMSLKSCAATDAHIVTDLNRPSTDDKCWEIHAGLASKARKSPSMKRQSSKPRDTKPPTPSETSAVARADVSDCVVLRRHTLPPQKHCKLRFPTELSTKNSQHRFSTSTAREHFQQGIADGVILLRALCAATQISAVFKYRVHPRLSNRAELRLSVNIGCDHRKYTKRRSRE